RMRSIASRCASILSPLAVEVDRHGMGVPADVPVGLQNRDLVPAVQQRGGHHAGDAGADNGNSERAVHGKAWDRMRWDVAHFLDVTVRLARWCGENLLGLARATRRRRCRRYRRLGAL